MHFDAGFSRVLAIAVATARCGAVQTLGYYNDLAFFSKSNARVYFV